VQAVLDPARQEGTQAVSLFDRVLGEEIGAAGSWDQTNPVGVSKQSRKVIGNFPLPLNRRRKKGERLDPNLYTEQQPAPISGWVVLRYPAGTKHAGKADVVIGKGGDRKRAKKIADSLRWIYGKRVKTEGRYDPSRCTNTVMRAFGVCANDAMNTGHILSGLRQAGWKYQPVRLPWDKKTKLRDFVNSHPKGRYVIGVRRHAMALIDGKLIDTTEKGPDGRHVKDVYVVWRAGEPTPTFEDEQPSFKVLRKGRKPLDPEERQLCFDRKAVWHNRLKRNEKTGEIEHLPTPAVWKSEVDGKTWYVTNTHRAYNVTPTLKATIKRFHDFIRGTA